MKRTDAARRIVVVGGPNGAGKSTCAPALLRDTLSVRTFINADEIARGLAGFAPQGAAVHAGRVMLGEIQRLVRAGSSFAVESTLAGTGHARWLRRAVAAGFEVHVVFLGLPSAELALRRVGARVAAGGHDVPAATVRRRFERGIRNFFRLYAPLADTWRLYDNSAPASPIPVAAAERGAAAQVLDPDRWAKYRAVAGER